MQPFIDYTPSEGDLAGDALQVDDGVENEASENEEEDECRVCRGPAEEGRPLIAPCKCSGSIGLTHQDCLVSWLEVTRGDGRCELCKTKFRFDPRYAENTPDRLPVHEVFLGLSSRILAKWLPFALRVLIAATLWLVVAPLLTSSLYHGWMHRPSSIPSRWSRDLIPGDVVSGAIIAAIVIISFLSLMSFADFLRVQLQHPERADEAQRRRNDNDWVEDGHLDSDAEGGIDEGIYDFLYSHRTHSSLEETSTQQGEDNRQPLETSIRGALERAATENADAGVLNAFHPDDDSDADSEYNPDVESEEEEDEDQDELDEDFVDERVEGIGIALDNPRPQNDIDPNNNRPFDPLDPALQDDQVDMEINVALDELLGLRGPPSTLIRNVLWLLAFNATYLGFFAFLPKTVGSAVYAGIFNTTTFDKVYKSIPYIYSDDQNATTFHSSILALNQASADMNTTFRLPDVATVTLGYFSLAATIVLTRYGWAFSQKFRQHFSVENTRINTNDRGEPVRNPNRLPVAARRERINDVDGDFVEIGANTAVGVALDASVAIVKVGILLFLKMFMLPQVLGLCLDASTISLLGHSLADRLSFAGTDLFSFILLHWVAGITFMLLVTVFLLQLREVTHPDILARLIRPQEPQPDLLGNLMNETVVTHIKRMLLSLAIYAPILVLHVTLPAQFLVMCGFTEYSSFFRLNFWHIVMPQMQIPLELILFHLSMLALLERYKNTIGLLQHNWMKFMCRKMGLTEYLLPLAVQKFELAGRKAVFTMDGKDDKRVDPFWYILSHKHPKMDMESFIQSSMRKEEKLVYDDGEVNSKGELVYNKGLESIRLPDRDNEYPFLPTKIGRYRLNLRAKPENDNMEIEFWREVPGAEIPRPPEGWDDLGAGGAFVQGRWAWAKEKRSTVEGSVARRREFRDPSTKKHSAKLLSKVAALMVLSWLAIILTVFGFFSLLLAVGRFVYFLFRVESKFVHDPLAFVIGGCLVFPSMSLLLTKAKLADGNLTRRFVNWVRAFKAPPKRKFLTFGVSVLLWCLVAPLSLGLSYEFAVVKTSGWFKGDEELVDIGSTLLSWVTGLVVLNTWAFFSYYSVFTKQFWANVGNGMLEPPLDENGNPLPPRNEDARRVNNGRAVVGNNGMNWQGKDGRVARFLNVWRACLFEWDWEKVDRVTLLDDFSSPIARQLASALVGSTLSFIFLMHFVRFLVRSEQGQMFFPILGEIDRGLFRQVAFRVCMVTHVVIQLCSAFRLPIEGWFEAAHSAARDDRYLIGEVLLNYERDDRDAM